jgi:phytoene/squalene synthetase
VRDLAREPMPGEIRLQWWREVLSGTRTGEAGPVASALMATIVRYRLPLKIFEAMIEARSFDLYDDPMGSLAELEGYAEKTSSALIGLAAQILNEGNDPRLAQAVRHAGSSICRSTSCSAMTRARRTCLRARPPRSSRSRWRICARSRAHTWRRRRSSASRLR